MRTIKFASLFRRDYRREQSSVLGAKLDGLLRDALEFLTNDAPLPPRFVDHALAGAWKTYRDRHIRLDLILIYRKMGSDVLELARLGSHSELGL